MRTGVTFLVERYMPQLRHEDIEPLADRLAAAAADLRAEGREIHWLRSLGLPDDETCLCTFVAPDIADVEEANRRANATYERIVTAISVERRGRDTP